MHELLSKIENDKYKLIRKIGEGSYGEIYEVIESCSGFHFAMKLMDFRCNDSKQTYLREVYFILRFSHPNILSIHDHYIVDDNYGVIITEKMDVDLMDYLLGKHSLPINESRFIFQQICNAISHLHSHSVAHCDIKPENILLRIENDQIVEVKLCDFGFAIDWKREERNPNATFGTNHYLPPECYSNNKIKGDKVDVWSLGVTLFAMLTSKFPFIVKSDGITNQMFALPIGHSLFSKYEVELKNGNDQIEQEIHELVDLFSFTFEEDESKRVTIDDLRLLPWLLNCKNSNGDLIKRFFNLIN